MAEAEERLREKLIMFRGQWRMLPPRPEPRRRLGEEIEIGRRLRQGPKMRLKSRKRRRRQGRQGREGRRLRLRLWRRQGHGDRPKQGIRIR